MLALDENDGKNMVGMWHMKLKWIIICVFVLCMAGGIVEGACPGLEDMSKDDLKAMVNMIYGNFHTVGSQAYKSPDNINTMNAELDKLISFSFALTSSLSNPEEGNEALSAAYRYAFLIREQINNAKWEITRQRTSGAMSFAQAATNSAHNAIDAIPDELWAQVLEIMSTDYCDFLTTLAREKACSDTFSDMSRAGMKEQIDEITANIQNAVQNGDTDAVTKETAKLQELAGTLSGTIDRVASQNEAARGSAGWGLLSIHNLGDANSAANLMKQAVDELSEEEWERVRDALINKSCDLLMILLSGEADEEAETGGPDDIGGTGGTGETGGNENTCSAELADMTKDEMMSMLNQIRARIQSAVDNEEYQTLVGETAKLHGVINAMQDGVSGVSPQNQGATTAVNEARSNARDASMIAGEANIQAMNANNPDWGESSEKLDANWAADMANAAIDNAMIVLNALSDDEWEQVRDAMIAENCDALMAAIGDDPDERSGTGGDENTCPPEVADMTKDEMQHLLNQLRARIANAAMNKDTATLTDEITKLLDFAAAFGDATGNPTVQIQILGYSVSLHDIAAMMTSGQFPSSVDAIYQAIDMLQNMIDSMDNEQWAAARDAMMIENCTVLAALQGDETDEQTIAYNEYMRQLQGIENQLTSSQLSPDHVHGIADTLRGIQDQAIEDWKKGLITTQQLHEILKQVSALWKLFPHEAHQRDNDDAIDWEEMWYQCFELGNAQACSMF